MGRKLNSVATVLGIVLALSLGRAVQALPVTDNLVVQLVADEGTTYGGNPVANGGMVAWWNDQATAIGGDNYAQVNTDTRRPRLYTNVLNGHAVLRFDGTDDLLCNGGTWDAMDGDQATWFVVFKSDFTTEQSLLRMRTSTNNNLYGSLVHPTNDRVISHSRTSGGSWRGAENTQMDPNTFYVLGGTWGANNYVTQWVSDDQGDQVSANVSGATNSGGTFTYFRIGTHTGGSTRLRGDVAEVLLYAGEMDPQDRREVEEHLHAKYFGPPPGGLASINDRLRVHATLNSADVGGGTVFDTAGGVHENGRIVGSVGTVAGQVGGALSFPGSDGSYVDFGKAMDPGTGSFTVSLWFKPTDPSGPPEMIASKGNASSSGLGWSIWLTADDLYVRGQQVGGGGNDRFGQHLPDALTADEWQHVALVLDRDNDIIRGFLNGSNDGWLAGGGGAQTDVLIPGSTVSAVESLLLGRRSTGGAPFGGLLDDFATWDRALSGDEIQSIYNAGLNGWTFTAIPEPTTMGLLGLGALGLLRRRRR